MVREPIGNGGLPKLRLDKMNRRMMLDKAIEASFALDYRKREQRRAQKARARSRVKVAKSRETGNDLADALIARDILSPGVLFVYRDTTDRLRREPLAEFKRRALRVAYPALRAASERKSIAVDSFMRQGAAVSVNALPGEDEADVPVVGASGKLRGEDSPNHGALYVSSVSFQSAIGTDGETVAWLECHAFQEGEGVGFASAILRLSWIGNDGVRHFRTARPSEIPAEYFSELVGSLAMAILGDASPDEAKAFVARLRVWIAGEYGEKLGTTLHVPARNEIRASGKTYFQRPTKLVTSKRNPVADSVAMIERDKAEAMERATTLDAVTRFKLDASLAASIAFADMVRDIAAH